MGSLNGSVVGVKLKLQAQQQTTSCCTVWQKCKELPSDFDDHVKLNTMLMGQQSFS